LLRKGDVLFNNTNSKELVGKTCYIEENVEALFSNHMTRIRADRSKIEPMYLATLLHDLWRRGHFLTLCNKWVGQAGINVSTLAAVEIPLPPLDVQRQIVAELDGYCKIIEGARQVIANYKPTIKIDPSWPKVKLGEVCHQDRRIVESSSDLARLLPYLSLEHVESETGRILKSLSDNTETVNEAVSTTFAFDSRHVLYGKLRPYLNKVAMPEFAGRCTTELIPLLPNAKIERGFLCWLLRRRETVEIAMSGKTGSRMPRANMDLLLSMEIPLPSVEVQRQLLEEMESERALVDANQKLVAIFEQKIQDKLAEIWGEAEQTA